MYAHMKILNLALTIFLTTCTAVLACEPINAPVIDEIIPNKLYASSGVAKSGEPVHVGVELVDQSTLNKWLLYIEQTEKKSSFYNSSNIVSKQNRQKYFADSGYTQEEYEIFCDYILQKVSQRTPEKNSEIKDDFKSAINAFSISDDGLSYVAYIAKEPVTGYFKHPDDPYSLKGYHEGYGNLLMCVRCKDILDTKVYNNRGIHRGLKSFIDGGYSELFRLLFARIACVFETKGKTHMSVSPLPVMFQRLNTTIPQGKVLTGEDIPEDLRHFGGLGLLDKNCVIDIPSLKEL